MPNCGVMLIWDQGNVSINTEWGAFGDDGSLDFIRTEYDEDVDKNSINPGKQKHEKMISGMYMGELVRLALERFTKDGLLFGGKGSDMLFERGLKHASEQDYINIRYICECISRRSAHLVSAGLATLLNKIGEKKVTIGIDGSVYRFHPHFHNLMMEKIKELIDPSIEFDLMLSEDGSGRGAALVAAVAARLQKQHSQT
ncbi:hypothetical protein NQ314_019057 [Rhamnusium bicolor]|uniref:Phosphotransferase n=1 Tax=Rhamnusium bicolor TaxID=1586634 RepID=A0AAV8WQG7_9CUCU|nr:hypothetical protein NQ314_019057 [Rhamnusium bicolor]